MKAFRHAAALALVGWYLIAAPLKKCASDDKNTLVFPNTPSADLAETFSCGFDSELPLGKWTVVQTFDAATDCTSALRDWEDGNYGRPAAGETPEHHRAINQLLAQFPAQCIATDDPRLKGK
jgi:hypothetical protein